MKRLHWLIGGASLLLAALASLIASGAPDGLTRAASDLGISPTSAPHPTPMPDYQVPGLGAHLGGGLAGVLGVLAVLALLMSLGWLLTSKRAA